MMLEKLWSRLDQIDQRQWERKSDTRIGFRLQKATIGHYLP